MGLGSAFVILEPARRPRVGWQRDVSKPFVSLRNSTESQSVGIAITARFPNGESLLRYVLDEPTRFEPPLMNSGAE